MCLDMCQQIDNRFINVKGLAGTLKEKRVLIVAISKYVNPVKHWFHVCRPATRTRHLHPSLVLYQPGSLMSSHVISCLGKLFTGSHAYLLLGTSCPMPFLCEFAQIESFPSSKTWKYGKKISGIDHRQNKKQHAGHAGVRNYTYSML